MGPSVRPKRRALTNHEFIVVIALSVCCALIAGIVLAMFDLPQVSGVVIVTLVLTAAMVAVVLRGRRARPAVALRNEVTTVDVDFTMVMRGYDIAAVNAVVQRAREAVASDDAGVHASIREELRQIAFPVRFRGYDREQVDEYFRRTATQLS
jgi:DivIVA domain-containing protein